MDTQYGRATIGEVTTEPNDAGGNTVSLTSAFSGERVDFSDPENIRIAAQNAIRTADGFSDLVSNNINPDDLSKISHVEMYLALSCLACEIYMKSIIYYEMKDDFKQIRGHKLTDLFTMMPTSKRDQLSAKYTELSELLTEVSDYFEKYRYDFELNAYNANLFPIQFMKDLKVISHTYPTKPRAEVIYSGGSLTIH